MRKFNLEISENELNVIRLSLACAISNYRNTRVQYSTEDLLKDSMPYVFEEEEKELLQLDKRLLDLKEE